MTKIVIAAMAVLFGVCAAAVAGETFKDCPDCPKMVMVPAGTFLMGSAEAETIREQMPVKNAISERPQHQVSITQPFALGQYAVTRGEFAAFVLDTGHDPSGCYVEQDGKVVVEEKWSWRNPGFEQTDQHPVVCVSHDDANRYAAWLREKTGKTYRLPSEAEWEYAARAGTATARYWGDGRDGACAYANVADLTGAGAGALRWKIDNGGFRCRDGYVYTAPVGSFLPNRFGLYDMLGNVQQWTGDCWNETYANAPSDGSAWTSGNCERPVVRGGAWNSNPRNLRSARRNGYTPDYRFSVIGFRVARTLNP
jgi:sulfatase modifying factor 1